MTTTKTIPRDEWQSYFARFSKAFLDDERVESASIEQLAGERGDQVAVQDEHLLGITWDPMAEVLEIALEGREHAVVKPREIHVIEDDDAFVSAIEIVREDETRDIVQVRRAAPLDRPMAHP